MQVNGVENDHSMKHHVTECIHSHSAENKKSGASALAAMEQKGARQTAGLSDMQNSSFSLSAWLDKALNGGKKLFKSIWGGSTEEISAVHTDDKGVETVRQPFSEKGRQEEIVTPLESQIAVAASGLQNPQKVLSQNPYFSAIQEETRPQKNVWQKMKVRFLSVKGYLTRQFSGRNSFQARQEQPKEDLRRHSRYRQDDLEVECILTDDSYLLDSYDKKGEYSKLSARK